MLSGLPNALSSVASLAVCKNKGVRPGPFYHANDTSVYLRRQRGRGAPDRKTAFYTHILGYEQEVVPLKFETPALGTETTREDLKLVLLIRDPSPTYLLGRR